MQLLTGLYTLYHCSAMKRCLLLFAALLSTMLGMAQSVQTRISRYAMPKETATEKVLILKMPYGAYNIEAMIGDTMAFKNAGEMMVDVICTDYPAEQSLFTLNANRVKELYKTFPFVKPSQINKLTCYRQTGGDEKEKALPMFHGLVVRYRAAQNDGTVKHDLAKLDELLTAVEKNNRRNKLPSLRGEDIPATASVKPVEPAAAAPGKPPYYDPSMSLKGKRITYIIGDADYLHTTFRIPDSITILDFKTAFKKDLISKRVYQQFKDRSESYLTLYVPLEEEMPVERMETADDSTADVPAIKLPDSAIIKTISRNHWKNITVVADVTGSMYPYNGQLLVWLQLHSVDSLTGNIVVFNDGDNRPDDKKKAGKTGGIYFRSCRTYQDAKALVETTMQKGAGGDFPENVIEALLLAEQQFPSAGSNVLIADNWADIRDKELMSRLTKPVKVIVCGVKSNQVNVDYLNLAFKTKGSLHLIEQDITELSLLKEGAVLKIGKTSYRIINGSFTELDINGDPVTAL